MSFQFQFSVLWSNQILFFKMLLLFIGWIKCTSRSVVYCCSKAFLCNRCQKSFRHEKAKVIVKLFSLFSSSAFCNLFIQQSALCTSSENKDVKKKKEKKKCSFLNLDRLLVLHHQPRRSFWDGGGGGSRVCILNVWCSRDKIRGQIKWDVVIVDWAN